MCVLFVCFYAYGYRRRLGKILQFVREWFSGHLEREIQDLLDRLAHCLQCPGVLPGAAVVFRGEEGTGKDALVQQLAWTASTSIRCGWRTSHTC